MFKFIKVFSKRLTPKPANLDSAHVRFSSNLVQFSFIEEGTGNQVLVKGAVGDTVLSVAVKHEVDIEGACGGELACSTCHVICSKELYDILPEKKDEEQDMLDLAAGLTDT
jgi:ferredoxin